MLFTAILFLISCLGALGQFLYPWSGKKEHKNEKVEQIQEQQALSNSNQASDDAFFPKVVRSSRLVVTCDIAVTGKIDNCHVHTASGDEVFEKRILCYVPQTYVSEGKKGKELSSYQYKYIINYSLD